MFTIKTIIEVKKSKLILQFEIKFPAFSQSNNKYSKFPLEFKSSLKIRNDSTQAKKILNIDKETC